MLRSGYADNSGIRPGARGSSVAPAVLARVSETIQTVEKGGEIEAARVSRYCWQARVSRLNAALRLILPKPAK